MITSTSIQVPPAAELRADRARKQIPIFILAAKIGIHPFRLGQLLNGRRVLTPTMARKIAKALENKDAIEVREKAAAR